MPLFFLPFFVVCRLEDGLALGWPHLSHGWDHRNMKCIYKYRVHGKLKPQVVVPIPVRNWVYELLPNEDGVITHIKVTVPVGPNEPLPTFEPSPEDGVAGALTVTNASSPFVQMELRAIEGLLSVYGIDSIDYSSPEIAWEAESVDEQERLKIHNFKIKNEEIPDRDIPPIAFDIVARSVIAAQKAHDDEVPLIFFRKGKNDYLEGRYIEAIYDFYFMFENMYGAGKTKNYAVKKEFSNSDEFLECINGVLQSPSSKLITDKFLFARYEKLYKGKSPEEVVERFVGLRGFLHHHSSKRRDIWHPENHNAHEVDAAVMMEVALRVAMKLISKYLFDDSVQEQYSELLAAYRK